MLVKWAPGTSIPWADLHLGELSQKQVPRAGTHNCIPYVVLDVYTCPCLQYTYFPLYVCMDIYFQITACLIKPKHAGTELSRFNWDNIMAADALAPYVARTSAAMIFAI